jgi:hypothetical protein
VEVTALLLRWQGSSSLSREKDRRKVILQTPRKKQTSNFPAQRITHQTTSDKSDKGYFILICWYFATSDIRHQTSIHPFQNLSIHTTAIPKPKIQKRYIHQEFRISRPVYIPPNPKPKQTTPRRNLKDE